MTLFFPYKVIHLSYNQLISCSLCSAFISPREYTSESNDIENEINEFYIASHFVSLRERFLEILHSQLSIVWIGVSFIMSR